MTRLHRFALLLVAATAVLLVLGALVTSTGAGVSVPTWPSTFASADPASPALAGSAIQQAHRVMAGLVMLLALVVAVLAWRADERAWMKGLASGTLATVVAQAVYGGIGVLNMLPAVVSVFHAALAQLFFGLTVALALFTSPGWLARGAEAGRRETEGGGPRAGGGRRGTAAADRVLSRWASGATAAIYLQVVVGAAMRHAYTTDGRPVAFALPASPRVFADLLPLAQLTSWDAGLDFLHRLVALAIALFVTLAAVRVFRRHPADRQLVGPAIVLALVLLAQVALGALTVLSGGHPAVSTTHAAAVILALAASLVLAFRSSHIGTATPPAAGSTLAAKGLAA